MNTEAKTNSPKTAPRRCKLFDTHCAPPRRCDLEAGHDGLHKWTAAFGVRGKTPQKRTKEFTEPVPEVVDPDAMPQPVVVEGAK